MPAMHISPFLVAVELKFVKKGKNTKRIVCKNYMNQHGIPEDFDETDSSEMMKKIAAVQIKYALLEKKAVTAFLRGGDFLWDWRNDKLYWHTYRDPKFVSNNFMNGNLCYYAQSSHNPEKHGYNLTPLAYQILQLLLSHETSIDETIKVSNKPLNLQALYTTREILGAIQDTIQEAKDRLTAYLPNLEKDFPFDPKCSIYQQFVKRLRQVLASL